MYDICVVTGTRAEYGVLKPLLSRLNKSGLIDLKLVVTGSHLCEKFGKRFIDDISVAEVNDYLAELYYTDNYSYQYTESFLKYLFTP